MLLLVCCSFMAAATVAAASGHRARKPSLSSLSPDGAVITGRAKVTLKGKNFVKVRYVKFGTKRGTKLKVASSKKLTVIAPKHTAGNVSVVVVAAAGTSGKRSFEYGHKPTLLPLSPASGPSGGGTKVTLKGKNFVKVRYVEFGTKRGTKLKVISSKKLTVVAPKHAAGKVSVVVVAAVGSSGKRTFKYVAAAAVSSGTGSGGGGTAGSPSWSAAENTQLPLIGAVQQEGQMKDISCLPSGSGSSPWCVAVDTWGAAVVYSNGSWGAPSFFDSGSPSGISCSSQSFCVAVDFVGNVYVSTNGGTAWGKAGSIDGNGLGDVSCTGNFCAVVSQDGKLFTFYVSSGSVTSQTTNSFDTVESGATTIGNVSCVSSSFCVTSVNVPVNDWTGSEVRAYVWNGGSWSEPTPALEGTGVQDGFPDEVGISCPTSSMCATIDSAGNVFETTNSGGTWNQVQSGIDAGIPNWISCQSATLCTEGDGAGDVVDMKGSSLSPSAPTKIDNSPLIAISCPNASGSCMAVDDYDGGAQYAPGSGSGSPAASTSSLHDTGSGGITSISCASATRCVGLGNFGQAEWTQNGGSSWTVANGVSEAGIGGAVTGGHIDLDIPFDALSCAANGFCAALDEDDIRDGNQKTYGQVYVSGDDGVDWTNLSVASGVSVAAGVGDQQVSCVNDGSGDYCAFVDQDGYAYAYHLAQSPTAGDAASGSWNTTTVTSGTGLTAVSCVAAASCVAVDGSGYGYLLAGNTWSSGHLVNGSRTTRAISCVTGSNTCVAVGQLNTNTQQSDIVAITIASGGLTATSLGVPTGNTYSLNSISCSTTTSCFAAGDGNDVLAFDPTSAATYASSLNSTSFGHADDLQSIASVSPTFAIAADLNGQVYVYAAP